MSRGLTRAAVVSTFARSFLIQGSWNYHTMLGSGFAFAMLPTLRRLFGHDPEQMDASVARHLEHFNAHPYLSGVALGAIIRLEDERADEETIRKFKAAVRGPLGGLGDALVWATWLPSVAACALILYWLGLPGWVAVTFFVVVYNLGHLGLRVWGFRAGLDAGRAVGGRLGVANLTGWTNRLQPALALLIGGLVGAVLGGEGGLANAGALWLALAGAGFVAGLLGGHRTWRPAAVLTVAAVATISVIGVLR